MHYKITFPREVGNPRRSVCINKEQFFNFINANNGSSNLYTTVYNFTEFRQPYLYPIYDSAIIDRLYFDCDQKIREGGKWVDLPAYENMLKIHEWCKKQDILHFPRCTGTGYDVIIATDPNSFIKNKKECVANAQRWLLKELSIKTDPQCTGDIARIYRVDNTFNVKPTTQRFCIPLDKNIIYLGEKKIFEIAKKQRVTSNLYGTKFWDIMEFDTQETQYNDFLPEIDLEINEKDFADLSKNIPVCIKNLLARIDLNWKERRNVILCLRDNCYLLDECVSILRKHLSQKKFVHCVRDERQPRYLYRNEKYLFPCQQELIELRACPHKLGSYCENAKHACLLYSRGNY